MMFHGTAARKVWAPQSGIFPGCDGAWSRKNPQTLTSHSTTVLLDKRVTVQKALRIQVLI